NPGARSGHCGKRSTGRPDGWTRRCTGCTGLSHRTFGGTVRWRRAAERALLGRSLPQPGEIRPQLRIRRDQHPERGPPDAVPRSAASLREHWFSAREGAGPEAFTSLISESNQDRLAAECGACVVYTHYGNRFHRLPAEFRRLIQRLSRMNGWFVPASRLLD